jgi:hypothetical protein
MRKCGVIEAPFAEATDKIGGILHSDCLEILDIVAELGKVNSGWRLETAGQHE